MNVSFEQIKECAVGVQRVWQDGDKVRFARMRPELEDSFGALRKDFYARAQSTTECRLEFHTDSRNLRIDLGVETIEENVNGKYEVFLDDLPAVFVKAPGKQVVCLELPEGDTHVTVALPCHNKGWINAVMVDEGSYVRPHKFDRKMLFLGDSITQGYNATHDAQSYSYTVARHFNAYSLNWAVGGAFFDDSTVDKTDYDPDIVVIGYGTNDFTRFHSPEEFTAACAGYLDKIKSLYGDKKVFVISPIWRADAGVVRASGTFTQCRSTVAREAEKRGFIHVDGYALCPHAEEYYADGYLHPNDLGFAHYARNLIKFMTPLI